MPGPYDSITLPIQGVRGNSVLNGTGAPSNTLGVNGDFYLDTTNNRLYGPKASNVWGGFISLVGPAGATGPTGPTGPSGGPAGPTGPQGFSVLNGASNPTSGNGVNGDFWINTTTSTLFGPKASGAWPSSGTSLIGPAGSAGATGATGVAGPTGPQGLAVASGSLDGSGFLNVDTSGGGGPLTSVPFREYFEFKTDATARVLITDALTLSGIEKRGTGALSLKVNAGQLLTAPSDFTSSAWLKQSGTTVPVTNVSDADGTSLADKLQGTSGSSDVTQSVSLNASTRTFIFGVYLKADTAHTARLYNIAWTTGFGTLLALFSSDIVIDTTWRYFELVAAFGTLSSAALIAVSIRPDIGTTNLPAYAYLAEVREQTTPTFPKVLADGDSVLLTATGTTDSLRATLQGSYS